MDARVDIYAVGVMALRDARRRHAVPRPQPAADPRRARHPRAGADRPAARGALARARGGGDALPRQAARRPVPDRRRAGGALEPLAGPSGGITPTQTRPSPRSRRSVAGVPADLRRAGAAAVVAAGAFLIWKPWARAAARPLDANLVAVLPFRTAGADPSVQYLRQGMVDLMQAKLTGEGGPRAADARSVLAAVRDAGGDADDLDERRSPGWRGRSARDGCSRAASWARRTIWW